MARKNKPAPRHEITMECNGKTYIAHYYVESGVVTVEAMSEDATVAEMSTQVGASAKHTARMLLNEMIDGGRVIESRS